MTHIAKAPFVKVSVGDPAGHSVARIVRAGGVIPDGVDDTVLTSLVERGLIEKVSDGEDGGTADDSAKKAPAKRKTAAEKKAEAEAAEKARVEAEASAAADTK